MQKHTLRNRYVHRSWPLVLNMNTHNPPLKNSILKTHDFSCVNPPICTVVVFALNLMSLSQHLALSLHGQAEASVCFPCWVKFTTLFDLHTQAVSFMIQSNIHTFSPCFFIFFLILWLLSSNLPLCAYIIQNIWENKRSIEWQNRNCKNALLYKKLSRWTIIIISPTENKCINKFFCNLFQQNFLNCYVFKVGISYFTNSL